MIKHHRMILATVFLGVMAFWVGCSTKKPIEDKALLIAQIGDRTISVNELIRRAEFSIRPPYCNGDSYIEKKIVLNTLVAEKLLALEAGDDNELTRNQQFQLYMKGRQEQAMRQLLYLREALERVKPDTQSIKKAYRMAGRKYQVSFFSVKDSVVARQIAERFSQGISFEQVYDELGGAEQAPQREVSWGPQENPVIQHALFTDSVKVGQVVGPLAVEENFYSVIRVDGWTDKLVMTEQDVRSRWQEASEFVRQEEANLVFDRYIARLMRGKRVEFVPQTFVKIVQIMGPLYLKTQQQKQAAFNQQFWSKDDDELDLQGAEDDLHEIRDWPFLRIDGETWTVENLIQEIESHPLVFRKRKIANREFAEQFKLAVVDLIRDKYITADAYQKGYDKDPTVQRTVEMWRDNLLATFQRNRYLESIEQTNAFNKNSYQVLTDHLNPYFNQLQQKYNDVIEINIAQFENLQLTKIDMFVIQQNVPYPIVVPNFPVFTSDHVLDYGRKMTQ